jgi:hypothetical protein
MKTIQYSEFEKSNPLWMADRAQYENYIPGGARLRRASVVGESRIVPSGSLVGRTAKANQFELILPTNIKIGGNFVTTNNTTLVEPAAQGATVIKVADTDGFTVNAPTNAITIGALTATIAQINGDGSIVLTTGLVSAQTAGTVVRLTAATPFVELFLTATELTNVDELNEFTQYRHGRMVYLNFLPGYAQFTTDVLNTITTLYHHIFALA